MSDHTQRPLAIAQTYSRLLQEALENTARDEAEGLIAASQNVAKTVAGGGGVHLFGSGHSALVAAEPIGRSGSLVPLNQIVDKTDDLAERLPGYGLMLAEFYDQQYGLRHARC